MNRLMDRARPAERVGEDEVTPVAEEERQIRPVRYVNKGLLLLRVVVGALFVGHAFQKLFGWFGGDGMAGWTETVAKLGLQPAPLWAVLEAGSELVGGLLLVAG